VIVQCARSFHHFAYEAIQQERELEIDVLNIVTHSYRRNSLDLCGCAIGKRDNRWIVC